MVGTSEATPSTAPYTPTGPAPSRWQRLWAARAPWWVPTLIGVGWALGMMLLWRLLWAGTQPSLRPQMLVFLLTGAVFLAAWRGGAVSTLVTGVVVIGLALLGVVLMGRPANAATPHIMGLLTMTLAFGVLGAARERASAEMRAREAQLRQAIAAANMATWVYDPATRSVYANDELKHYYNLRPNRTQHSVNDYFSAIHPDDVPQIDAALAASVTTGQTFYSEFRVLGPAEGEVRWVVSRGEMQRSARGAPLLAGAMMDITQRKQDEHDLRVARQRFELALRNVPITMFHQDTDLRVTWIYNPRITTTDPSAVLGKREYDMMEVRAEADHLVALKRRVMETRQSVREEVRVTARGQVRHLDLVVEPRVDEQGTLQGVTCVFLDVTPLRTAENELRALNQHLDHLVQERTHALEAALHELEAFSYSVSHDLRAPLRAIDGFSLAVLEDYAHLLPEDGLGHLARVRAASQRMGQLIDDLLTLSRMSRGDLERVQVDMTAMCEDIIADLRAAHPAHPVLADLEPGMAASGDMRLLRVALENLLSNAWKFTARTTEPRVSVRRGLLAGQTAFTIIDNGAGFDMAYADKLFRPFQRLHTKDEFDGSGIGLATVRRIITRHGGTIQAEGAVGQGARFTFTLPD